MKKNCKIKKIFIALFLASSLCALAPMSVGAATDTSNMLQIEYEDMTLVSETTEQLEAGYILKTKIHENSITPYANTYTKAGQKTITFETDSGTVLWKYVVTGVYTVESGVSAVCTKANGTPTVYDNAWSKYSNNVSISGNKAIGVIRMQERWMGLVVQDHTETVTLTCSVNGVLS